MTATPATKEQLEALIDLTIDAGMNEAAGLMILASSMITDALHPCCCFEVMGDNEECPKHGHYFTHADQRERRELYNVGMGG